MPLTLNPVPLAAQVKKATERQHAAVEEMLLPYLAALQQRSQYATLLRMFYGYYAPLENGLLSKLTVLDLPDLHERRKAGALLQDLRCIGEPTTAIPLCTSLPPVDSVAKAFGVLYVLEGSTLGGAYITRLLQKNSDLQLPDESLQFFAGYRQQTGAKWKAFLEAFNGQTDRETVMQSSNETFTRLHHWMQQSLSA